MLKVKDDQLQDDSLRVHIVVEMLLSGLQRIEIIENIKKGEGLKWEVSESEIDELIAKAKEIIIDDMELDNEIMLANLCARYDFVYKKMINVKDYKGAILAIDRLAALRKEMKDGKA